MSVPSPLTAATGRDEQPETGRFELVASHWLRARNCSRALPVLGVTTPGEAKVIKMLSPAAPSLSHQSPISFGSRSPTIVGIHHPKGRLSRLDNFSQLGCRNPARRTTFPRDIVNCRTPHEVDSRLIRIHDRFSYRELFTVQWKAGFRGTTTRCRRATTWCRIASRNPGRHWARPCRSASARPTCKRTAGTSWRPSGAPRSTVVSTNFPSMEAAPRTSLSAGTSSASRPPYFPRV